MTVGLMLAVILTLFTDYSKLGVLLIKVLLVIVFVTAVWGLVSDFVKKGGKS
ncbi:hypothetical protein P7266_0867 [Lactococcus cremoris]|nr:hypothetical protein P7266_0867 [Lactococcus cremoris]